MKLRAILLLLMIVWDASLHWVDLLGKESSHFLYLTFPLFNGLISYNLFWTIFWTFGFLLMLTLLGSGTTVKNKTIVKNYITKPEKEDVERVVEKSIQVPIEAPVPAPTSVPPELKQPKTEEFY